MAKWNAILANQVAFHDGTGLPSSGGTKAYVSTQETTASATFVRLTTTTDAVTVTVGSTGLVLLCMKADTSNVGAGTSLLCPSFSGATTATAATNAGLGYQAKLYISAISIEETICTNFLVTGLTPGSTTFSMNYATTAGTAAFQRRFISAIPL